MTHAFRHKPTSRLSRLAPALFFLALAATCAWLVIEFDHWGLRLFFGGSALGALALILAARREYARLCLTLSDDHLHYDSGFKQTHVEKAALRGFRRRHQGAAMDVQLFAQDDTRIVTISVSALDVGEHFEEWLEGLTNLDAADEDELLRAVEAAPGLGDTAEGRRARHERIRRGGRWLNGIAVALGMGALMYPHPLLAMLAIPVPLIATMALRRLPLSLDLDGLSMALLMPGITLGLVAAHGPSLVSYVALLPPVAGGAALLVLAVRWAQPGARLASVLVVGALTGLPWAYGIAALANHHLDRASVPMENSTVVEARHRSSEGLRPSVAVRPWRTPLSEPVTISTSWRVYGAAEVGNTICVLEHPGALGAPWVTLDVNCEHADSAAAR